MAKNKKNVRPHYEMLYIVSNRYTEEEVQPVVQSINGIIEKHGGAIGYQEVWGRKKLCYPINHEHYGYYFLTEFDLENNQANELNRELELNNEVVRHMIVSKKARSLEQIEAEKRAEEKRLQEKIKKAEEKEVKTDKEVKKEINESKKALNLKDLDEKLDKILDTDDLL